MRITFYQETVFRTWGEFKNLLEAFRPDGHAVTSATAELWEVRALTEAHGDWTFRVSGAFDPGAPSPDGFPVGTASRLEAYDPDGRLVFVLESDRGFVLDVQLPAYGLFNEDMEFQGGDWSDNAQTPGWWPSTVYGAGGDDFLSSDYSGDRLFGEAGNDTLKLYRGGLAEGGDGDDWLLGFGGEDVLRGGDGADRLEGGTGHDNLGGGEGDDTLAGGFGDDLLDGGAGGDLLDGGRGFDIADYRRGDIGVAVALTEQMQEIADGVWETLIDVEGVYGSRFADVLGGTDTENTLAGGDGDDRIDGLGGDDLISGGEGDDRLHGGEGFDTLSFEDAQGGVEVDLGLVEEQKTGEGYDLILGFEAVRGGRYDDVLRASDPAARLEGGGGDDALYGKGGDDLLMGGTGADRLSGGDGADQLDGAEDADDLDGGEGRDQLWGGEGDDRLAGGEGDDHLAGGEGDDMLLGGAGDDWLRFAGGGVDVLDGGDGFDILDLTQEAGGWTVDLSHTGPQKTGWGAATFTGIEMVLGSRGVDQLIGGRADDNLWGMDGADRLAGGDGRDSLEGGDGDDRLDGGEGSDWLVGGAGADQMTGGAGDDNYWVDDAGDVVVERADGGRERVFASIDYRLGAHVEDLSLTATDATGYGNALNNELLGSAGAQRLYGLDGDDALEGDAGDDLLEGGAGDDRVDGGDGEDTASYAGATAGVSVRLGVDAAQDTGGAGRDVLGGIENLVGSRFADRLTGDDGANRLDGGDGDDRLDGGGGDDVLAGGRGSDVLTGGAGDDVFVAGWRAELGVTDFEGAGVAGGDRLDLRFAGVSFAALDLRQDGDDAVITVAGGTVRLLGVQADALTAQDFLLSGLAAEAAVGDWWG